MYAYELCNSCAHENFKAFGNWMRTIKKKDGQNYSFSTIQAYQIALKGATAKLNSVDRSSIKMNLFEYDNFDDFQKAVVVIKNAPNYEEVNIRSGSGAYSAAIKKYGLYLRIKERNKSNTFSSIKKETVQAKEPKKSDGTSEAYLMLLNRMRKTCEHFKVDFTEFVECFLYFECNNN